MSGGVFSRESGGVLVTAELQARIDKINADRTVAVCKNLISKVLQVPVTACDDYPEDYKHEAVALCLTYGPRRARDMLQNYEDLAAPPVKVLKHWTRTLQPIVMDAMRNAGQNIAMRFLRLADRMADEIELAVCLHDISPGALLDKLPDVARAGIEFSGLQKPTPTLNQVTNVVNVTPRQSNERIIDTEVNEPVKLEHDPQLTAALNDVIFKRDEVEDAEYVEEEIIVDLGEHEVGNNGKH